MPQEACFARIVALVIVLSLATTVAGRAADCPPSRFAFAGGTEVLTTSATKDTSIDSFGAKHIWFDLTAGIIGMDQCCSFLDTYVQTSDLYDVTGVAPGTPVALTARLTVDGSVSTTSCGGAGCGGHFYDQIKCAAVEDHRNTTITVYSGSVPFHDDLSIPLTIVAGTPAQIDLRLSGARSIGGSHETAGAGTLTFTGLPPGVTVISCQGYSSAIVTPVQRTSWGQLKVRYR